MVQTINKKVSNYINSEKRMASAKAEDFIPADKAMQELGINDAYLEGTDVELE
ncbi:hypothetical protein [Pelotomaculum propionicicum]|uniref:hypothetical protein n=1 Tax=Pelotomaculum propionicicum TaxID=258475 RepID=UPI0018648351|nr:hypothetical protein [Pelotomaculum propionicicum]